MSEIADDAELVARAKADAEAFGALYERYVKKIYNYVYYRTGDPHEAEDLTARVFQRAMVSLDRYTSRGLPFSAWLYRIAHNLVANWHRDRGRRKIVPSTSWRRGICRRLAQRRRRHWQRVRKSKSPC